MTSDTYVTLSTGAHMPKLGLGTWQQSNRIPGQEGSDAGLVKEAVKVAVKAGYRQIDTAWAYFNEGQVGEALKELFAEGVVKREDIFLTTKLFSFFHHKDDVEKVLREQLEALGLDYVDMYLVHGPIPFKRDPANPKSLFPIVDGKPHLDQVDHLETWQGMEVVFEKGLAKAIGVSNFSAKQIQRIIDNSKVAPHCLQVECHAYHPQTELFEFCKKHNIVFMAYAPIGSPGAASKEHPILMKEACVVAAAEKHHKTPAQVLIRWLYERGMVVIPKSTNSERIKQNLQVEPQRVLLSWNHRDSVAITVSIFSKPGNTIESDIFEQTISDFQLTQEDHKNFAGLKRGPLLGGAFKVFKGHPQYPFDD